MSKPASPKPLHLEGPSHLSPNSQMPIVFFADILKSSIGSSFDSNMPFAPFKVKLDGSQDF